MLPAYASSEWEPFSSQSFRCSYGPTSSTTLAPASSQRGRPAGNRPGDHPFGVRLGGHRRRIVVALRGGHQPAVLVRRGRRDPVHHRGGEVDVRGDPVRQRLVDRGGQLGDDGRGHLAVLREVVTGEDRDRAGARGAPSQQSRDQPAGQRGDRRIRIGAQGRDVAGHRVPAGVEVAVRAAYVARLGDRDGDHGHLRPAQVVQVGRMVGGWMHRNQGLEDRETISIGAAGDQGVEAVLRRELFGGIRPPAGERRDPPLGRVRGVRGVPGLMSAVEVAEAEVDEPHRSSRWEVTTGPAEPRRMVGRRVGHGGHHPIFACTTGCLASGCRLLPPIPRRRPAPAIGCGG